MSSKVDEKRNMKTNQQKVTFLSYVWQPTSRKTEKASIVPITHSDFRSQSKSTWLTIRSCLLHLHRLLACLLYGPSLPLQCSQVIFLTQRSPWELAPEQIYLLRYFSAPSPTSEHFHTSSCSDLKCTAEEAPTRRGVWRANPPEKTQAHISAWPSREGEFCLYMDSCTACTDSHTACTNSCTNVHSQL